MEFQKIEKPSTLKEVFYADHPNRWQWYLWYLLAIAGLLYLQDFLLPDDWRIEFLASLVVATGADWLVSQFVRRYKPVDKPDEM